MPDTVILADQNIPRAASDWLRERCPDWAVHHASGLDLSRSSDEAIAAWAEANRAIVLTFDEDFGDHRPDFATSLPGVIRLRVWPTTEEQVIAALTRLLEEVDEDELYASLVIVGRSDIRVRPWPPRHEKPSFE